jgi:hypothetical protein
MRRFTMQRIRTTFTGRQSNTRTAMTMRFPVRKNRDHVVSAAESLKGWRDMNGSDGCRRTSPGGIDDGDNAASMMATTM